MTAKHYILILTFVLVLPGLFACSLPAEPCAAIVPIDSAGRGMKLVPDGSNKFFYLVPQGTSASFKVVWDPAAHNTGNGLKTDKYDWCTKAEIDNEPGTDRPGGYGYFPIQAMADFFSVQGNRGSIQEAFSREMGVSTADGFLPSVFGPYSILSGFVKEGNDGRITTLGGQSNEYPSPGIADVTAMSDESLSAAQDINYPATRWHNTTVKTDYSDNPATTEIYLKNPGDTRGLKIRGEGLLIEGMDMEVTQIRPTDYKAFIRTDNEAASNEAASIEVQSSPQIVWHSDGSNGTSGPDFSVTFNTPSFNGNKDQSKIRLKVWSPGAGFEISNVFWAWKETVYVKDSKRVVTREEETDEDGNITVPEQSEIRDYWRVDGGENMCSEELQIKLIKSAAEAGSTDFIVYDDKSPIASEFKITSDANFVPSGPTTVDFSLRVLDTNPYFNKLFTQSIDGVNLSQSKANLDLQVFYSYPHYKYEAKNDLTIDKLRNDGYGIADKQDLSEGSDPTFKSFNHTSVWHWKKADVPIDSLSISEPVMLTGSTGRRAGAICTISGKINIQQPRPWHECNEGTGVSVSNPKFKVFAISGDTIGKKLESHDTIKSAIGDSCVGVSAIPDDNLAAREPGGAEIPPGDTRGQISGGGIIDSRWSNVAYLKAKDEVGPEIQVIVFDTRTNRYHTFGTRQNVAAGFSEFGSAVLVDDYSSGDIPYQPDQVNSIDNAHKFSELGDIDGLFIKYLKGPNAVSTIAEDSQNGFVCQQNNRLVFYIRAVDNINSYEKSKNFGISDLACTLSEKNGVVGGIGWPTPANMLNPVEHVFRYENVDDGGGIDPQYFLKVVATDHSSNKRTFNLNIAVLGRKLDIRTLEERRQRID